HNGTPLCQVLFYCTTKDTLPILSLCAGFTQSRSCVQRCRQNGGLCYYPRCPRGTYYIGSCCYSFRCCRRVSAMVKFLCD
uniref:Beta-defensin-like domain-containing protein n=1 Tax=Chelydra serpentina TaxID=8475 RepID=A0A8C3SY69_CHESE